MSKPIDPTSVRQGRLGKQVLVILVASLALAFIAAWVLWGAVADDAETAELDARSLPSIEMTAPASATAVSTE